MNNPTREPYGLLSKESNQGHHNQDSLLTMSLIPLLAGFELQPKCDQLQVQHVDGPKKAFSSRIVEALVVPENLHHHAKCEQNLHH